MKKIEIEHLSFSYDEQIKALDDVSFSIEEGSYTVIVGHNGSGKSTIAKLLIGLLEAQSGTIRVDGIELKEETVYDIRDKVGIVFQNPDNQFIGATVADDIAFGLENHQVPHENDSVVFGRNKNNTAAMGSWDLPIACAGEVTAYTMRFNLTPEVYYTQPAALPQACVSTFVCVLKHCVGHLNACTVFSCFLHPLAGWSIHTGGLP